MKIQYIRKIATSSEQRGDVFVNKGDGKPPKHTVSRYDTRTVDYF